jgi:branched-chain amino acid aminotransferase
MTGIRIDAGVAGALAGFTLPEKLGFGLVTAPVMFSATYDGGWDQGELVPYGPIELLPGARVLHYAELVFEGMKAYRVGADAPNLFRPLANYERLRRSAERLAMQPPPGLYALVRACTPIIPRVCGQSLYLRPFLFGTEPGYHIRPSTSARFMVIANPAEVYSSGPMKVAIERADSRASPGGTGVAKTGGNYAASLRATRVAADRGYTVALWLDAASRRYIQELSGMNLFAVINGELHTPALDGAILEGITRDSLITLARSLGLVVVERPMEIDALAAAVGNGSCTELFACGTAAIVSPIAVLGEADGREYHPRDVDQVAARLREGLLAIQERRAPDPFGWVHEVPAV